MSSIANSSARHVRFGDKLPKPPSDRYRVDGVVYPRVAQIKGEAHTHDSFDLHWKYECLSVASRVETVGTMEVKEDERKFTNPRLAQQVQYTSSPPRATLAQRIGEMTPKLSNTALSDLLNNEQALNVLCNPPLLCSSRTSNDGSSLGGNSAYSESYSSSCSSSDSDS